MQYAKAIVATIGAAVTAALAIFPSGTSIWNALTIVSAALTAIGVYLIPNTPAPAPPAPAVTPSG